MVRIIDYEDRFAADFKRINMEWLTSYNLVESHDLLVLNDPAGTIVASGGCIFLAQEDGQIIGTAGLAKSHDAQFELMKMAVTPAYRGRGISRLLIEKCIQEAKVRGAGKLMLYSNSQLKTAIGLYERYGFRHLPANDGPFVTADVKMELQF